MIKKSKIRDKDLANAEVTLQLKLKFLIKIPYFLG